MDLSYTDHNADVTDMKNENERLRVRSGYSRAKEEAVAVQEFAGMVDADAVVVVFFASSEYDLERLGAAMKERFQAPVIGCTTAGEITPEGYSQGGITGFSLASDELEVYPYLIPSLHDFNSQKIEATIQSIQERHIRLLKSR